MKVKTIYTKECHLLMISESKKRIYIMEVDEWDFSVVKFDVYQKANQFFNNLF